jgi:hypothetical protein
MAHKTALDDNQKGLFDTIKFCVSVDILFVIVWFFETNLSSSFIAVIIPGIVMALLITFCICFAVSLFYATRIKRLTWIAVIPLFINVITVLGIFYLIKLKVGK